jgi:hypothetical protein
MERQSDIQETVVWLFLVLSILREKCLKVYYKSDQDLNLDLISLPVTHFYLLADLDFSL